MGQASSVPEEGAETLKHFVGGEDSTDNDSNSDGDDSSFAPSSSDSSEETTNSIISLDTDREKPNRTQDLNMENEKENENKSKDETNNNSTNATAKTNETKTIDPNRRFLLQPSTPSQWLATFRKSTDDELISLLEKDCSFVTDDRGISLCCDLSPLCAELRRTASRISEYREFEKTLGPVHSESGTNSSTVCFYNFRPSSQSSIRQEDEDEDDHDLIDLCERILQVSSIRGKKYVHRRPRGKNSNQNNTRPMVTLSRVRQKLVPSKLKEHVFWESLWVLLYERKTLKTKQDFFKTIENTAKDALEVLDKKGIHTTNDQESKEDNNPTTNKRIELLEGQLETVGECISGLMQQYQAETRERKEMEKLVEKMWKMIPKNCEGTKKLQGDSSVPTKTSNDLPCVRFGGGSSGDNELQAAVKDCDQQKNAVAATYTAAAGSTSQNQKCQHIGTWIMSKDSIEFLAFPSEAKEALRTEKQKRLKRVNEEMAFILDSDDPKDSHGEWSCCHKTDYYATCGGLIVGE